MLAVVSVGAEATRVYCDVQKIFEQSAAGQELSHWNQLKTQELNSLLTTEQTKLRKLEQEISASNLPEDAARLKSFDLEHAKRLASLQIEKTKNEMEQQLAQKMKSVEAKIQDAIKTVAVEHKWSEVCPKAATTALFVAPELDKTDTILEAFNRASRAEAAKAVLRTDAKTLTA